MGLSVHTNRNEWKTLLDREKLLHNHEDKIKKIKILRYRLSSTKHFKSVTEILSNSILFATTFIHNSSFYEERDVKLRLLFLEQL